MIKINLKMIQFVLYTTLLYAVSARVAVNMFDDEPKQDVVDENVYTFEVKCCQPQYCDWTCRNMGFRGGACINGQCRCDHRLSASGYEEPKQDVVDENEYTVEVRSCQPQYCDRTCRNMGFRGGACIHGQCKCDHRLSASNDEEPKQDVLDENENNSEVRWCQQQYCDRQCRNMGFRGGACINGQCKCDHRLSASSYEEPKQDVLDENENNSEVRWCQSQDCDWRCRNMGYRGGACINGQCKCDHRLSASNYEEPKQDVFDVNLDNSEERWCQPQDCDRRCRNMGFRGGACINGQCKCDHRLSASSYEEPKQDVFDENVDTFGLQWCQSPECDRNCRNMGFHGGACINGECKCNHRLSASGYEEPKQDVFDENVDTSEVRWCQSQYCDWKCRNMGSSGGACINGKCKCDHKLSANSYEEPKQDAFAENVDTSGVRRCHSPDCDRNCRNMGFHGGACVDGQCKCNHRLSVSSYEEPKQDVFDENMDTHCQPQYCDRQCRNMGFRGGACSNGKCKCDHRLSEIMTNEIPRENNFIAEPEAIAV